MRPTRYVSQLTRVTVFIEERQGGYIGSTAKGDSFGRTIDDTVALAASRYLDALPSQIAVTHDFQNVWVGALKQPAAPRCIPLKAVMLLGAVLFALGFTAAVWTVGIIVTAP